MGAGTDGDVAVLPAEFFSNHDNLDDFCNEVFPNINDHSDNYDYLRGRVILCPTNEEVLEVNKKVLSKLAGELSQYDSLDSVIEEHRAHEYPVEFLNTLHLAGWPEHALELKKNCIVMLLINLDQRKGHCNGTRYKVLNLSKHVIELLSITGKSSGSKLFLPRTLFVSNDTQFPFQMKRKQFPIRYFYFFQFFFVLLF